MKLLFKHIVFFLFSFSLFISSPFTLAMSVEGEDLFTHIKKTTSQWKELVKSKKETNFMKVGVYAKYELEDKWDFYDDKNNTINLYVSGWFEQSDKLKSLTVNSEYMKKENVSFSFLGDIYGYNTTEYSKHRPTYSMRESNIEKIKTDFSERGIENPINTNQKFNYQMYAHTENSFFSHIQNNKDYLKHKDVEADDVYERLIIVFVSTKPPCQQCNNVFDYLLGYKQDELKKQLSFYLGNLDLKKKNINGSSIFESKNPVSIFFQYFSPSLDGDNQNMLYYGFK